jgi:hypothetical protein
VSAAPAGDVRPHLTLVTELPRPHGLRYRLFKVREATETVRYRVLRAVVPRLATRAMRERAWLAGFTLALGGGPGRRLLEALEDEQVAGNEYGWDLRHARDDRLPGPCRPLPLPASPCHLNTAPQIGGTS